MEEGIKNRLILALIILTIIFFILSLRSCLDNRRQKMDRDKEMALRMELEEKMSKTAIEKTKLEDRIKELERLREEEKTAHEAAKLANKTLRDELEKITKLKETLEEDLKEALVNPVRKDRTPR